MSSHAQVDRYATLVGDRFELVRELPGGRALEITDRTGSHFVLKWDDDAGSKSRRRRAIAVAERLGFEAGWPVPTFELAEGDDRLFVRQTKMSGAEPAELTESLWNQVCDLTGATAGLGSEATNDWPHRLLDTLVAEPSQPTAYCSHEPLRRHSDTGRRLIMRIEELGAAIADLGAADDLIHWDLHPGNLLVVDGAISAVIDLDNAGPGPRGFDLITFALSAHVLPGTEGLAAAMLADALGRSPGMLGEAAIAHLILRFSNWAIRTGHEAEAAHWIAEGERRLLS